MKTKHIIFLGLFLAALIVAVVLKQLEKAPELASEEYSPLNLGFDPSSVEKIEILKGTKEKLVELVKGNEGWRVANLFNARADEGKIQEFMKKVREAKGELRGQDKTLFRDFVLEERTAYRLVFFDKTGQALLDIYLSPKRAGYELGFLRKADSEAIYLAQADLFGGMGLYEDPGKEKPKADYWAHLSLAGLDVDSVAKIETIRWMDGKEIITTSVVRTVDPSDATKKRWKYQRPDTPFGLDAERVKQYLNGVPTWKASKALDPKAKDYGFATPRWEIRLGLEGGREIVMRAGNQDPDTKNYMIQVSTEPVVFELPDYYFRNFDVDDSKFFIDNPLGVSPEITEELIIHIPGKELKFNPKQKKWDALTTYLNDLKALSVTRLLYEPSHRAKVKSPASYRLEVRREGEASSVVLDAGASFAIDNAKEYAAQKRDGTQPFAIAEVIFKKLFDNLERLDEPKT